MKQAPSNGSSNPRPERKGAERGDERFGRDGTGRRRVRSPAPPPNRPPDAGRRRRRARRLHGHPGVVDPGGILPPRLHRRRGPSVRHRVGAHPSRGRSGVDRRPRAARRRGRPGVAGRPAPADRGAADRLTHPPGGAVVDMGRGVHRGRRLRVPAIGARRRPRRSASGRMDGDGAPRRRRIRRAPTTARAGLPRTGGHGHHRGASRARGVDAAGARPSPRERSGLGWFVLGMALAVAGLLATLDQAGAISLRPASTWA